MALGRSEQAVARVFPTSQAGATLRRGRMSNEGGVWNRLRRVQLGGDVGEKPLVGIGTGEQEAHAARVAGDDRPDLE